MAYVVADPCIGTKDRACVEVCPVSCFYENEDQLFIHPQECIDCDACVPVCPVTAIFPEAEVPKEWNSYIQKGIDYFAENAGVPAAKSKADVGSGGVGPGSTHWTWKGQPAVAAKAPAAPAAAPAKVETTPEPAAAVAESPPAPVPPQPTPVPAMAHAAVETVAEAPAATAPPKPIPAPATVHATADTVAEAPATPAPPKPAPAVPATAAPTAKPAAKPAPPPIKPMDPGEYRRLQALLYQVVEMLGGSRPFDIAVFSEAEEAGRRLKREVAVEFGKDVYVVSELEKKGMALRQKHDLAQGLLQAAGRAQFIPRYRGKRQRFMQLAAGGAVTGLISVVSGLLSLQTIRIDTLLTDPKPSLGELLGGFLNAESFIPFLGFQTIAGLMGIFTLYAIYQCWQVGKQLHELKRTMQTKHIDPRMIARLA
jgi:NAD-dependent dihydropyrimidine dehydrogenase PreA subunit